MASIINTNIAATRTHNVYNRNSIQANAAMTRVATGMKINSAKDGASTWAISEKMRERIRANDQANQNVQNDTAMLKVAQGGIGNTLDILKTLKERAINAANDSNLNEDRSRIATEVFQLVKQIDDNAEKVKFNGRTLLNGGLGDVTEGKFTPVDEGGSATKAGSAVKAGVARATTGTEATNDIFQSAAVALTVFKEHNPLGGQTNANVGTAATNSRLVDLIKAGPAKNSSVTDADHMFKEGDIVKLSFTVNGEKKENTFEVTSTSTLKDLLNGGLDGNGVTTLYLSTTAANITTPNAVMENNTTTHVASTTAVKHTKEAWMVIGDKDKVIDDISVSITGEGEDVNRQFFLDTFALTSSSHYTYQAEETPTASSDALTFYIGGEANFGIEVSINAMNSAGLGLSGPQAFAEKFLTKGDAEGAIATIDKAINTVLDEQTRLGAIETRLGYASDNIVTMNENLEAADSVMRDSDIAKEMTNYMKYSVLSQASQYMLAQAGQNAFQVLNLLQQ